MKFAAWTVLLTVVTVVALVCVVCVVSGDFPASSRALAADAAPAKAKPLPALKVDRGAPLLLDDAGPKKEKKGTGPVADNQACFVCHTNYQEEEMAVVHAENDVGCIKCHGSSLAHRNDENNTTPPDTMFPAEAIEKNCATCHEEHNAPAKKVIAMWQQRCPTKSADQLLCTDCHACDHRLKHRNVRWDKKTGKLLFGKPAEQKGAK